MFSLKYEVILKEKLFLSNNTSILKYSKNAIIHSSKNIINFEIDHTIKLIYSM
jgi:hypothetical protein